MSEKGIPAADAGADDSFWRSLRFFTIYRLSIAALFLVAALAFGDTISLGTQDARLFGRVAAVYLLLAVGFLVVLLRRPRRFNLQLSAQVAVDVAALTLMMFASGGQKSGIAMLLLVVVAGAALVGQGRMTLFYAYRDHLHRLFCHGDHRPPAGAAGGCQRSAGTGTGQGTRRPVADQ